MSISIIPFFLSFITLLTNMNLISTFQYHTHSTIFLLLQHNFSSHHRRRLLMPISPTMSTAHLSGQCRSLLSRRDEGVALKLLPRQRLAASHPANPLPPSMSTRRCRLAPCAHLSFCYNISSYNRHNNNPNYIPGFTFPFINSHFLSLPLLSSRHFSSSPLKSGSDSPGSGLVTDMGSENKLDAVNSHHHHKPSKFLTLPTILTLGRVAAVPLLICTFYMDSWWGRTATTSIFVAAAITDWLDGYLARKMRLGSAFGAFLDPVADKLMVAATLVLLCTKPFEVAMFGPVPWLLTVPSIAIIGREITMSAVREWAASQNTKLLEAVAVNNLGKWKTATQMTALTILLATRGISAEGTGSLVASGVVLLYISAGLSVWSLAVYMSKIWRILLK